MILKIVLVVVFVNIVYGSHWQLEEKHHAPYKFGYEVKDKEGSQHRHEESDGNGNVRGSYGYTDHKGLYREVHYIADKGGFRAVVNTNEPGTANQNPAAVQVHANLQHHIPLAHNSAHHHHSSHIPFIGYNSNYFAPIHGYSYNPSLFHDYGNWPFPDSNKYRQFHAHEHSSLNNLHQDFNHLHGFKGFGFNKEEFSGKNGFEEYEPFKGLNFEADLRDGKHKSWRYGNF